MPPERGSDKGLTSDRPVDVISDHFLAPSSRSLWAVRCAVGSWVLCIPGSVEGALFEVLIPFKAIFILVYPWIFSRLTEDLSHFYFSEFPGIFTK